MTREPQGWAPGSGHYLQRRRAMPEVPTASRDTGSYADTGIIWEPFDYQAIPPSDIERARHRFRSQLPELIWNAAALEGNTFTLPEVKTLLNGVTVGGRRLADESQILALSEGYNLVDDLIATRQWALSKAVSDELHGLVARHEAIECGHFRGEGSVVGGGTVRLASGGAVAGTPHGERGENLVRHHNALLRWLDTCEDARERALVYFASATRRQFYFDGNKRVARLMMTGELIANGFDLVSIPFARRLELNTALDAMFSTDDATELLRFLITCTMI